MVNGGKDIYAKEWGKIKKQGGSSTKFSTDVEIKGWMETMSDNELTR